MTFWNQQPPKRATKAERVLQSEIEALRAELERQKERVAILESELRIKDAEIEQLAAINELNIQRVQRAIREVCQESPT